jgi:hypothetical protein
LIGIVADKKTILKQAVYFHQALNIYPTFGSKKIRGILFILYIELYRKRSNQNLSPYDADRRIEYNDWTFGHSSRNV